MKRIIKIVLFFLKSILIFFELVFSLLFILLFYLIIISFVIKPNVNQISIEKRQKINENYYQIENSWLKKNTYGVWEMYVEGDPYKIGKIYGALSKELIQKQESHFVNQIDHFVPSSVFQHFLRLLIGYFNRDLIDYIPIEYQKEMLGISEYFDKNYNYISTPYARILNYHAAHDIGHALADYRVVGCSSFGVKGKKSADSNLLIARNFDFYIGDDFAKDKLILFVNPKYGYSFASYSWAGFIGVVSGINEKGLTVTLNAAKSELPIKAKMPISILAREILQYCSTIDEAIKIAKKREIFVSESLLISSKKDNDFVIIEKTPTKTSVYKNGKESIICTNHYQSNGLKETKENILNAINNDTKFRFNRLTQLLARKNKYDVKDAILILRDQKDLNNDTLGMGNPRAINQLIAHHSVVFQPEIKKMWISTSPFQLGKFISYSLDSIFKNKNVNTYNEVLEDEFLFTESFRKFQYFHKMKKIIIEKNLLGKKVNLSGNSIKKFINSNKEMYLTYSLLGDYYFERQNYQKAKKFYLITLKKKVASKNEIINIKKQIEKINRIMSK